jgi:hypothetical protein
MTGCKCRGASLTRLGGSKTGPHICYLSAKMTDEFVLAGSTFIITKC